MRYHKYEGLTSILSISLSIFYTRSPHFSYQVRCDPVLLSLLLFRTVVDSFEIAFIVAYSYLNNPLDIVLQTFVFITYLIIYVNTLFVRGPKVQDSRFSGHASLV